MTVRYSFDIETDNLLALCTVIHSLVIENIDTRELHSFADQPGYRPIREGLAMLAEADLTVGHNSVKFDTKAIQKLVPPWSLRGTHRDTLIMSRMAWPDIVENDQRRVRRGTMPARLTGKYSLEAFGYRLGNYKGDFKGPWDEWSVTMQDYCEQDVRVTTDLFLKLEAKLQTFGRPGEGNIVWWERDAVTLEHEVAEIIFRQEQYGFAFDVAAAQSLYGSFVQRRMELESEVKQRFRPWFVRVEDKVAPRTLNRKRSDLPFTVTTPRFGKTGKPLAPYVGPVIETIEEGAEYTKIKLLEFNCNSRHHIADRLKKVWGWKPKEFTDGGDPKIDDEILGALPYPEAALLAEYLMIQKRIGMLAEGDAAWLKVEKNGRIHGGVNSCGTPTARMTHSSPNVAQVPAVKSPYGKECRSLFIAGKGKMLVGCDADSLEMRDLAGYMARYDGGDYVEVILKGRKEDGTDNHSVNARALDLDPLGLYPLDGKMQPGREVAKRWFYAFIYGAGDPKLGYILGAKSPREAKRKGAASRATFLANLPALGAISNGVRKKALETKTLRGLDGRHLYVRSPHSALNTLLQSAGAIQMKRALVILDVKLQALGLTPGVDYEFVANVHDEWQIEVSEEHVETVKNEAEQSIRLAGEHYDFGCPLKGNADHGRSWADTH